MEEKLGQGELDILNIILESGLVVKAVLLLLIFASIVSWAIVFYKKNHFRVLKNNDENFLELFNQSSDMAEVKERIGSLPYSPYKTMFEYGFEEVSKISQQASVANMSSREYMEKFGFHFVERGIKKGVIEARQIISTQLSTLASISSVSPFIGLFGTVWGIINSFTGLASGGGTLDAVAPGIAEALVATAVGLAAAIPATWFYNHFQSSGDELDARMETFEQELLNNFERVL
jgi:biopolymer transport protein TolQ